MQQDGETFKAQVRYAPYFLLATKPDCEHDVEAFLRRRYEGKILNVTVEDKEDLDLKNHLSGLTQKYLKVTFATVQDLMDVRREVLPMVKKNQSRSEAAEAYEALHQMEASAVAHAGRAHHGVSRGGEQKSTKGKRAIANYADAMMDIREYDVPYHMRFLIDTETRCGWWYQVKAVQGEVTLTHRGDMLARGEVKICAFDIETTKLPLQVSRRRVRPGVHDLVHAGRAGLSDHQPRGGECRRRRLRVQRPSRSIPGPFIVWNEPDEAALLRRWFDHMREVQPSVYVTYNGDFFDWPFVETRAEKCGMSMYLELGLRCDRKTGECRSRSALHLDAFAWVKRDSYLPAGSHGLKAVTKAKLGYNPVEVDPRTCSRSRRRTRTTWRLLSLRRGVHLLPLHDLRAPLHLLARDDHPAVPRRGAPEGLRYPVRGAADGGGVPRQHRVPNKTQSEGEKHFRGHLLESETYIGGHVECLEAGVFRADIPTKFRMNPKGYQGLLDSLDEDLKYALYHEGKQMTPEDVENYDEVRAAIAEKLVDLRDNPTQMAKPLIYHLDVAAMYPNIILTNRLQPSAMVTEDVCASCDFNRPGKTCLREMEWLWRGRALRRDVLGIRRHQGAARG